MITIDELMTAQPYSLQVTDSISDAWKIMLKKNIRHIPVTNNEGNLLGLVTQRDILESTLPANVQEDKPALHKSTSSVELSTIMHKDIRVIHTSDSVRQAATYMQSHKIGCLPVVVDDKLVGIITDSDFVSIAINLLEQVDIMEQEPDDMAISDSIIEI